MNQYKSLLTGMTDDGYYSLWYMPFAKSAMVELINEDKAEPRGAVRASRTPRLRGRSSSWAGSTAKWHRDVFPLGKDRWPDWTMLRTEGRGRFCGVMLHVWNPRGGWWGEGDEKFSWTARSSPPPSAPARRTTSAMPGATRSCSRAIPRPDA